MTSRTKLVVWGAMGANLAITISKYVAATITGSSAMLSEAIHSTVDSCNGLLLLVGMRRSRKPADEQHPFGHGKELYFWSLIVAIMIFGMGGGMSVYEGILHLMHPTEIRDPGWSYVVLAFAFLFEGISWTIAMRELVRTMRPGVGIWATVHRSKDPSVFTILFEDTAALLGIVVAFLGVFLGRELGRSWLDGAASILIGAILATVALFLSLESKGLLVGESADPELVDSIRAIAESDAGVVRAARPLTMHLAPHQILLNLDIKFRSNMSIEELERTIDRLEKNIRERHPDVQRIFIEAEALKA